MVIIPGTQAMCRVPTSYTGTTTTTSAHSDDTDGTTGTCNGSPKHYLTSLCLFAIKIPSFDWDKGNGYSEWLRFRIEIDFTLDTPTYASFTAKE